MAQKYRFNYVQELFETDEGEQYIETERSEWVKYEDYAALEKLVSGLINCELDGNHADGHRYREELMALLNISYGGD